MYFIHTHSPTNILNNLFECSAHFHSLTIRLRFTPMYSINCSMHTHTHTHTYCMHEQTQGHFCPLQLHSHKQWGETTKALVCVCDCEWLCALISGLVFSNVRFRNKYSLHNSSSRSGAGGEYGGSTHLCTSASNPSTDRGNHWGKS